jgi:tRNA A37 threonylcarbamoyladenosine dehydratase
MRATCAACWLILAFLEISSALLMHTVSKSMSCKMSAAAETATDYYALRFAGVSRLYSPQGLENLRQAHVCVVGLGGVGSWAVEALARRCVSENYI